MSISYTQADDITFEKNDSDGLIDRVVLGVIGIESTDSNPKTNTSSFSVCVDLETPTAEESVTQAQIDTAFAAARTTTPPGGTDDVETIIANNIVVLKSAGAAPDPVSKSYSSLPTS